MLATLIVNDLPAKLLQETTTLETYCRDIEAAATVFIRKSPEYATQIRAYALEVKTIIEG